MQFEDLNVDAHVQGLVPGQVVQVAQVKLVGTKACHVTSRDGGGTLCYVHADDPHADKAIISSENS